MSEPLDRELHLKAIVTFVIALVLLLVVAASLMGLLARGLESVTAAQDPPPPRLPEARAVQEPPAPHLQTDPLADIAALHAEENQILQGYAWVDREAGVARIPVARAIEILAARNGELPATDAAPQEAPE